MAVSLVKIWKNAPLIGRASFLFRLLSYGASLLVIYVYHREFDLTLNVLDYAIFGYYVLLPFLLFYHYYFYHYNRHTAIRHIAFDFFSVGLFVGLINFNIFPSVIFLLAAISNEIASKGFKNLYQLIYIVAGAAITFILGDSTFRFEFSYVLGYLSLIYGVFHFVILSYISYLNARELHYKRKEVENQQEEIKLQSEELNALNERLMDLNKNLESAVEHRTQELKIKNRQLAEYAFINAHKLRAPIATLQGLLHLIDRDEVNRDIILKKIKESIEVLVLIVTDIRIKLEREEGIKNPFED
ncbi:MAG: hypothetical protein R3345_05895 [Fulvivirga sp.]|nr:hypothetical protein [Fulvivirga sp.]